ncbi:MAG: antibiotic biosynthesis monooxygenase family protein, partial [bacterium]
MVLTVFRSRIRPEAQADYQELAPKMSELAQSMPGYRSHKVFVAEDGERLTLVEFEDDAAQFGWANHPEHRSAQSRGRAAFYSEYTLQVCE